MNSSFNIVRNLATKEFWVAEPKYENRINDIVEKLKSSYGDKLIFHYQTSAKELENDIRFEEQQKGLKRKHFTD